jgi:ectoine hydroxylase-related dioxygenase (phytanoyl-CoA dioxygenase family)
MDHPERVLGAPVHVEELTANAGDVVLWHPLLLHCAAPNALPVPRVMLTHSVTLR